MEITALLRHKICMRRGYNMTKQIVVKHYGIFRRSKKTKKGIAEKLKRWFKRSF